MPRICRSSRWVQSPCRQCIAAQSRGKCMSLYDLIIRGGTVVTTADVFGGDIAIADGKIVDVAPEIGGTCDEEIDATGLHVFPGVIDAHVHFDEPGRTDWEGFATGTSALAAGGGTTCFDMPLNAHPPTLDG